MRSLAPDTLILSKHRTLDLAVVSETFSHRPSVIWARRNRSVTLSLPVSMAIRRFGHREQGARVLSYGPVPGFECVRIDTHRHVPQVASEPPILGDRGRRPSDVFGVGTEGIEKPGDRHRRGCAVLPLAHRGYEAASALSACRFVPRNVFEA